ncbi:CBU_0592 family membrane protein [Pseudopontixanthobacter vadosimaris]|uniref:CBU_0592 family membrane protein n=1 Tax=Pseudopontixanthobacter vadosimaris TaxID=2726450 RepID=UPI001475AD22|nr:permease [Pseudopontixanthobacter vadosimaris]
MTSLPIMDSGTANIVGFAGMVLIVAAYAYVTAVKQPNPVMLHGTNLVGAALLALSLLVNTNLPSLVLEGVWASVAIWGLVKAIRTQRRNRTEDP